MNDSTGRETRYASPMSDSKKLMHIHSIRKVERRWKGLSACQKRRLLDSLPEELNEAVLLDAIKTVRTETVTDDDVQFFPTRIGAQYGFSKVA